ncbi:MAG: ribosome silencing factor [Gemmataceae bacterium]
MAEENKAKDILILDLRKLTPQFDFFVLMTGASRRQIRNLAEETDAALHRVGDVRKSIQGYQASRWIAQDYGDIVVHVFDPMRAIAGLEELWPTRRRWDWKRS